MSKKNQKQKKKPAQKGYLKKMLSDGREIVNDGWQNALTGLGTLRDKKTSGVHGRRGKALSQEYLEGLYDEDFLAGRIVDLPAQEIYREWIDLKASDEDGETDVDTSTFIMQAMDDLDARSIFAEAETWARLQGGALILMGVDDKQEQEEPLDMDNIQSVDWISVVDRWDVNVHEKYTDPLEDKFGKPKIYSFTSSEASNVGMKTADTAGKRIHESRTISFDGVKVSRRRRTQNNGWGNSVLERYYETIRDFQGATSSVMTLLQEFNQGVFKIKGLSDALSSDADNLVRKRLEMLDVSRAVTRAVIVDAEAESFETVGATVGGMADLYDRMMMTVSAASGIPVTLLFGRSPAGENATGESDIRLFYDHVKAQQETSARRRLEYFISVLLAAKLGPTGGNVPSSWGFTWNPLFQETTKEKAEARKLVAETDKIYIDTKVLFPREVADNRYGGDTYSLETSLDQELRAEKELEEEAAMEAAEKRSQLSLLQFSQENEKDAPGLALAANDDAKDGKLCSSCLHGDGIVCNRWAFQLKPGFKCDDFEGATGLIKLDKKTRERSLNRRPRGKNY